MNNFNLTEKYQNNCCLTFFFVSLHSRRSSARIVRIFAENFSIVFQMLWSEIGKKTSRHLKCIVTFAPHFRVNKSTEIYITIRNENKQFFKSRTREQTYAHNLNKNMKRTQARRQLDEVYYTATMCVCVRFVIICRKKHSTHSRVYHMVFLIFITMKFDEKAELIGARFSIVCLCICSQMMIA